MKCSSWKRDNIVYTSLPKQTIRNLNKAMQFLAWTKDFIAWTKDPRPKIWIHYAWVETASKTTKYKSTIRKKNRTNKFSVISFLLYYIVTKRLDTKRESK